MAAMFQLVVASMCLLPRLRAQSCWSGDVTPELCCVPAPKGNPACWDAEYTYERCCKDWGKPASPSKEVAALKMPSSDVPSLRLLSGGHFPMSGVGLCCRASANGDAVRQGVLDFLTLGGRLLDTAQLYGNHKEVGQGVREAVTFGVPREEIFLTSKIWPDTFGFEAVTEYVDTMLEELGLDYVDLVELHQAKVGDDLKCKGAKQCRQESWLALQRAQKAGKIKHLGVSNFGPRQMSELIDMGGSPIDVNQLEYHPWIGKTHRETVEWCHAHGIVVTAYASMGSSRLSGQMLGVGVLQDIGKQYGKTAGQVLLRWAIQKNVTVIPGTSNPKHQAENLRLFDFRLSDNDMATLDSVPEDQYMQHYEHIPDSVP